MSDQQIYGFEADGACIGTFTPGPTPAQCPGGSFQSSDPKDYGSAGASFFNINSGLTSATVFLNLAPGASTFFSLEGALSVSDITSGPGNTGSGVPEPASLALLGIDYADSVLSAEPVNLIELNPVTGGASDIAFKKSARPGSESPLLSIPFTSASLSQVYALNPAGDSPRKRIP